MENLLIGIVIGCILYPVGQYLRNNFIEKYENKNCSGNCNQGRCCNCKCKP